MDKSKVVHPRIATDIIIGCYDILEIAGGRNLTNLSTAVVIGDALKGFVRGAQKTGIIPEYTIGDLRSRYDDVFGTEEDQTFEVGFRNDDERAEDEVIPKEELMAQIEKHMDQVTASAVVIPGELENKEPAKAPVKARPKWDSPEAMHFDTLASVQPLDRFIVQAKEADDVGLKTCVSLVYVNLPEQHWGSPVAEKAIQEYYDMYLEDHP